MVGQDGVDGRGVIITRDSKQQANGRNNQAYLAGEFQQEPAISASSSVRTKSLFYGRFIVHPVQMYCIDMLHCFDVTLL
ncbi:Hypothetical protein NTJ_09372 [Nesidiocoris tenuis]|uniref:Uncharacterized protein n=1 Tax=Nesidiocoris tenuis TaxID=355587 RepID=A0ABN7AWK0_9HEMI|nr:Hypothetical protein NTJ_09372 [Nesidiocoris tenuis]